MLLFKWNNEKEAFYNSTISETPSYNSTSPETPNMVLYEVKSIFFSVDITHYHQIAFTKETSVLCKRMRLHNTGSPKCPLTPLSLGDRRMTKILLKVAFSSPQDQCT